MKWWNELKKGDVVFIKTDRPATSGPGNVVNIGRKYIEVFVRGRSVRVRKSDGCVHEYPCFPIARNRDEYLKYCELKQKLRSVSDRINEMCRDNSYRPDEEMIKLMINLLDAKSD